MGYLVLKTVITALIIVAVSEVSKRSTFAGGLLASLPLVSVLAMIWLYVDTKNASQVADLATSILWLVIPSLTLFIMLPILLRRGVGFPISLVSSLAVMMIAYLVTAAVVRRFGVAL